MNIVKNIMFLTGAGGGLVGFISGTIEAIIDTRENSKYKKHLNTTKIEETIYCVLESSQTLTKPILYGFSGAIIGATFPISFPIIHVLFRKE